MLQFNRTGETTHERAKLSEGYWFVSQIHQIGLIAKQKQMQEIAISQLI